MRLSRMDILYGSQVINPGFQPRIILPDAMPELACVVQRMNSYERRSRRKPWLYLPVLILSVLLAGCSFNPAERLVGQIMSCEERRITFLTKEGHLRVLWDYMGLLPACGSWKASDAWALEFETNSDNGRLAKFAAVAVEKP